MQRSLGMRRAGHFLRLNLLVGVALALAYGAVSWAQEPKTFQGSGLVRAVDQAGGMVTIRHEEIPGLRRGGTSVFTVRSPGALEAAKPGDRVRFTTTEELVLLEVGPPAAQAPGPSGGGPATAVARPELGVILGEVKAGGGLTVFQAVVRIVELNRELTAGSDGTFRFSDVPPGTYMLRAEGNASGRSVTGEQRAVVPPGGTARVTILTRNPYQ